MAKIDTSKIEGYDQMTAEEKLAALEAFEYEDHSSEVEKYKNAASKANSEAADWKKKHNALLSEEEQKKQKAEEEVTALREEVAELKRDKTISESKSQFLAQGYSESLAQEAAEALAENDTAKLFAAQKNFLEEHDKAYKAQLMGEGMNPAAGQGGGEIMTIEKLRTMSPEDRWTYSQEHPEEYEKLYGGN